MKEFLARRFKYFLIILLSLSVLYIAFRYFYPKTSVPSGEERSTTFGSLNLEIYQDVVRPLTAIYAGSGTKYWEDWNIEDQLVFTVIEWVDYESNALFLYFNQPKNQKFSDNNRLASIQCLPNETVITSNLNPGSTKILDGGFKLIEEADPGDTLFTYCLNEDCTQIGKACILMKYNYQGE